MQKFKLIGKPLLGEKYVEGKKERRRKNNGKFSDHLISLATLSSGQKKTISAKNARPSNWWELMLTCAQLVVRSCKVFFYHSATTVLTNWDKIQEYKQALKSIFKFLFLSSNDKRQDKYFNFNLILCSIWNMLWSIRDHFKTSPELVFCVSVLLLLFSLI